MTKQQTTCEQAKRLLINATTPPGIYTLSLHDALPILMREGRRLEKVEKDPLVTMQRARDRYLADRARIPESILALRTARSEEHTSELQSRFDLVCRLLLEKKKTT